MNTQKRYRVAFFISIVIVIFGVVFFFFQGTDLGNTVMIITAVIGAISIWFQMRRSKDMAEGEFILALNENFSNNDDIRHLQSKLYRGEPITEDDRVAIIAYFTFFETLYLLIRRDVLDFDVLDDLFRERYVIAINNSDCQALELVPAAATYRNLFTLDHLWTHYRQRQKDASLESTLPTVIPDFDRYVIL